MQRLVWVLICMLVLGCTQHRIDTVQEWCERISGVNLEQKYGKPWAVFFAVSVDGDAIRDDFTRLLNEAYLQRAQNRIERMVWREGTTLHVVNPASFLSVNPDPFVEEWKHKIDASWEQGLTDEGDQCMFSTTSSMFDSIDIHLLTLDANGTSQSDSVSAISTDREKRLGDKRI